MFLLHHFFKLYSMWVNSSQILSWVNVKISPIPLPGNKFVNQNYLLLSVLNSELVSLLLAVKTLWDFWRKIAYLFLLSPSGDMYISISFSLLILIILPFSLSIFEKVVDISCLLVCLSSPIFFAFEGRYVYIFYSFLEFLNS